MRDIWGPVSSSKIARKPSPSSLPTTSIGLIISPWEKSHDSVSCASLAKLLSHFQKLSGDCRNYQKKKKNSRGKMTVVYLFKCGKVHGLRKSKVQISALLFNYDDSQVTSVFEP